MNKPFRATTAALLFFFLALLSIPVLAGPPPPPDDTQSQRQYQDQDQSQSQAQNQTQSATSYASSDASNQGNSLSVSEKHAGDIVLIPQQHTASCQRTFGFAYGNDSGGGGFGIPFRDKNCDFDKAALAAHNEGNRDLAWYWRCHKKSLYRTFDGASDEAKIAACYRYTTGSYPEPRDCKEQAREDYRECARK